MVGLASKKLLLSWSNDLDIVWYWNCSFTKQNAQLHVSPVNHDRSRQCSYDSHKYQHGRCFSRRRSKWLCFCVRLFKFYWQSVMWHRVVYPWVLSRNHQDQWEPRIGIWLLRYEAWSGASSSCLLAAFSHSSSYHGPPWSSTETSSGASSCLTLAGSTPCTIEIWSPVLHIFCEGANNRIFVYGTWETNSDTTNPLIYCVVWEKFRDQQRRLLNKALSINQK